MQPALYEAFGLTVVEATTCYNGDSSTKTLQVLQSCQYQAPLYAGYQADNHALHADRREPLCSQPCTKSLD